MQRFYWVVFIVFLLCITVIRVLFSVNSAHNQLFPDSGLIKFEAILKSEPKIYDSGQVINIRNLKIYTDLFPRYHEGEKILMEGEIKDGKIFQGNVHKIADATGLVKFRSRVREKIAGNIDALLPQKEATLLLGATMGVDSIDKSFRDQLTKTGTIHVVVVSGQNLTLVAGAFLATSKLIGRRKSLALAICAVVFYAFLTGFEPPVVRAGLMVIAASIGVYFGREADTLLSLFLAALVIVLVSPQALFEVSFQLTFAATLGIVTLGNRISNFKLMFHKEVKSKILNLLAVPLSAYIFTAPVILYYFGQVSALSPMANVMVAEAVAPIMALGFLAAGASLIFMPLAQILAYFAFVPAFYFAKVVEVFAQIPVGQINLGKGSTMFVILYYVVLLFLLIFLGKKAKGQTLASG